MRVIAVSSLVKYWTKNKAAQRPLENWLRVIQNNSWANPVAIKKTFGSASVLRNGRVVFNVGGNKYRIVTSIAYSTQIAYIKFVGTHDEYDRIDAQTIEYKG
jgi:mRNA interferase HigB